jgi:hypothetical protein
MKRKKIKGKITCIIRGVVRHARQEWKQTKYSWLNSTHVGVMTVEWEWKLGRNCRSQPTCKCMKERKAELH